MRLRIIAAGLVLGLTLVTTVSRGELPQPAPEAVGRAGPGETPESAEAGATPIEAPDGVVLPKLIGRAVVPYPEGATGTAEVLLELSIDAKGSVVACAVLRGDEPFAQAAREAALTFRFAPARLRGTARAARISFSVEISPPPSEIEMPPPEAETIPERRSATSSNQPGVSQPAVSQPGVSQPAVSPQASEPHVASTQELEVAVSGTRETGNARVVSDSVSRLVPGAEGDPLRALQALPGALPIFAASPFLGLHGSPPAKIAYEFDGIRVPYLYHLGLSASVVHPWMVDSASIFGAGPARLGQAVGGQLEARASTPERRWRGEARIRTTESAAGVEAPIVGGRGSVLLAGRYSYMEPLVSLVAPEFRLNYWDYQGRVELDVSERDTLELLALGAGDLTRQIHEDGSVEEPFNGSFHRVRLAWTHALRGGGSLRWSVLYGHDRWDAVPDQARPHSNSVTARGEATMRLSRVSLLEVGGDVTHRLQHDEDEEEGQDGEETLTPFERNDLDVAAWIDWIYGPTPELTLSLGVRTDILWSEAALATPEAAGFSVSPRQSLTWNLHPQVTFHQSAGLASQRPSGSQRTPGHVYSPEGGLERSFLLDAGLAFALPLMVKLDVAGFAGAFFDMNDVDTLTGLQGQPSGVERALGRVVGLETSLLRAFGRHLRGVVSYTLSRAERSVGVITAPARYDRTHVLSVSGLYDFGRGWSLSSRVLYYSGFPARVGTTSEAERPPRTTPYLQLDVQAEKRWSLGTSGATVAVTLGMLNVLLRKDSTDLDCRTATCDENLVGPAAIPTLGITGTL